MSEKISIELDREDCVSLGKFVSRFFGQSTDPVPIMRLMEQFVEHGIGTDEMNPRK